MDQEVVQEVDQLMWRTFSTSLSRCAAAVPNMDGTEAAFLIWKRFSSSLSRCAAAVPNMDKAVEISRNEYQCRTFLIRASTPSCRSTSLIWMVVYTTS